MESYLTTILFGMKHLQSVLLKETKKRRSDMMQHLYVLLFSYIYLSNLLTLKMIKKEFSTFIVTFNCGEMFIKLLPLTVSYNI